MNVIEYALVDGGVNIAKLNKLIEPEVISLEFATLVKIVAVEFWEKIVEVPE